MKTCTKCKESKSTEEFPIRAKSKDGKHSWCKSCFKSYKYKWDSTRTLELQNYVFEYLSSKQCVVCKTTDVLVLEFDHVDSKTKQFNIGKATSGKEVRVSLSELIAEIEKCDVVCRNCHQRKTHEVNNSWRYKRLNESRVN